MSRFLSIRIETLIALMAALFALALVPPAAGAHVLSNAPQYTSVVGSAPAHVHVATVKGTKDVRVSVDPGHTLVITGYDGEPLIRIDQSGVAINRHSPTSYAIRPAAPGELPVVDPQHPLWLTIVPKGHGLTYHDQRIAWLRTSRPAGTSPWRSGRQRIHAWTIPVTVDGRSGTVRGTLYYTGGNAPWATLGELLLVLVLCAFVTRSLLRSMRLGRARRAGIASAGGRRVGRHPAG